MKTLIILIVLAMAAPVWGERPVQYSDFLNGFTRIHGRPPTDAEFDEHFKQGGQSVIAKTPQETASPDCWISLGGRLVNICSDPIPKTCWEYRECQFDTDSRDFKPLINAWGQKGWEMIGAVPIIKPTLPGYNPGGSKTVGIKYIFKRSKDCKQETP